MNKHVKCLLKVLGVIPFYLLVLICLAPVLVAVVLLIGSGCVTEDFVREFFQKTQNPFEWYESL